MILCCSQERHVILFKSFRSHSNNKAPLYGNTLNLSRRSGSRVSIVISDIVFIIKNKTTHFIKELTRDHGNKKNT